MVSTAAFPLSCSATGLREEGTPVLRGLAAVLARLMAALGFVEDSVGRGASFLFSDVRGPMLAKRPNDVEEEDELDDEEEDEEDDDLDDDEDDFEDDEEFEEEFGEDELDDDDDDIFYDDDDDE